MKKPYRLLQQCSKAGLPETAANQLTDVDQEKTYVFFKNDCPMVGPLYDAFSICDIESGNVLYWVTPKSGHTGKAEIVKAPDFGNPIHSADNTRELIKQLNK